MGPLGINGVGVAYLISQVAVAAALFPLILRILAPEPPTPVPAERFSHEEAPASRSTTNPKMGPKGDPKGLVAGSLSKLPEDDLAQDVLPGERAQPGA
jgi:hypothetical protein